MQHHSTTLWGNPPAYLVKTLLPTAVFRENFIVVNQVQGGVALTEEGVELVGIWGPPEEALTSKYWDSKVNEVVSTLSYVMELCT